MKVHKSKIGKVFWVFMLFFAWLLVYGIVIKEWVMIIIGTLSTVYFSYVLITLRYIIDNEYLTIKTRFIFNQKFSINSIRTIEKSNSIQAAAANSFDRLEIIYNKFDSILVSPENNQQFIEDLLSVNPKIEVKNKKLPK